VIRATHLQMELPPDVPSAHAMDGQGRWPATCRAPGSKAAADRAVDDLRQRYRPGVKALRTVRVIDPGGNLRILDFEREAAMMDPGLDLIRQRARVRERVSVARVAAEQATEDWELSIRDALAAGLSESLVAEAAGTNVSHVRALQRRKHT
jgi:hypothetical protein